MSIVKTFRNALSSMFQSAVEEVVHVVTGSDERPDHSHPLIHAAGELCHHLDQGKDIPDQAPDSVQEKHGHVGSVAWTCVCLYWDLFKAEFDGDKAQADKVRNDLEFSNCDVKFAETIVKYLEYFGISGHKNKIPYVKYNNMDDFVMQWLPPDATVAILGDWATGTATAKRILEQVKAHNPDVVLHVGDIYYSGTQREAETWFLDLMNQILERDRTKIPVYTMSGNHDMYSGGQGYYTVIKQLNPSPEYPPDRAQQASYLCLRTTDDSWQFLCMDTGLNDHDPFDVTTVVTYLEPDEVKWHVDKLEGFPGRSILLSHHQLFSAFEQIGVPDDKPAGEAAFNPKLLESFREFQAAGDVAAWFWGHEHNLCIYEPFGGLEKGFCVGHSAVPNLLAAEPYEPLGGDGPWPKLVQHDGKPVELGNNGTEYNHGFVILKLNGRGRPAVAEFYQDSQPNEPLYTSMI